MVSILAVYVYRDIWPMATYDSVPADINQFFLWHKIGVVAVLTLFIPLCMPHRYIPVDPEVRSLFDTSRSQFKPD